MHRSQLMIFALESGREFGAAVCRELGVELAAHEERSFEDGEHKTRPLVSVRGQDVYVVQSLYTDARQSVNDQLARLLFFLGALRDASAGRVTAVVPYLCYSRKDRMSKTRDPVTTRYIARLFEAMGIDHLVTIDVHNLAAFQNAFRIPTDHLEAKKLLAEYLATQVGGEELVVVSPDTGGVKRAEAFRQSLGKRLGTNVTNAFVEKYRSADVVSGDALVGDVAGKTAIIVDDLISSGTTLARAAAACQARGSRRVLAVTTHGVFSANANAVLAGAALEKIVITNTLPPLRLHPDVLRDKVVVLDAAPLVAAAIRRLHGNGSIVELME